MAGVVRTLRIERIKLTLVAKCEFSCHAWRLTSTSHWTATSILLVTESLPIVGVQ